MGGDILQQQAPQAGSLRAAGPGSRKSASGQPAGKQLPQAPLPRHSEVDVEADVPDPNDWEVLPRQWDLADFKPLKKLYRGYASKVYLAEDCGKEHRRKPGGEIVKMPVSPHKIVLKVYDLLRLSPLTKYQLQREVRLHKSVQHKNIVRLVSSFTQVSSVKFVLYEMPFCGFLNVVRMCCNVLLDTSRNEFCC
jgi:serine/threonine protein kinase